MRRYSLVQISNRRASHRAPPSYLPPTRPCRAHCPERST